MTTTAKNVRAGCLKTVALVIALVLCWYAHGLLRFVENVDSRTRPMTPAVLSRAASALNATLPMMMGANTTWIRTTAVGATLFLYDYRLTNVTIEELASTDELREDYLARFATETHALAQHTACASSATRDGFLGHGVTLRYRYYDRNGAYLYAVDVTPVDCGLAIRT